MCAELTGVGLNVCEHAGKTESHFFKVLPGYMEVLPTTIKGHTPLDASDRKCNQAVNIADFEVYRNTRMVQKYN